MDKRRAGWRLAAMVSMVLTLLLLRTAMPEDDGFGGWVPFILAGAVGLGVLIAGVAITDEDERSGGV
ncbi:hypothetical protein [Kytococcus sedentarius]|uniref:hypothetical protein n=1 Tax=Kytococcus sedentarius TaxID=1276 RepID=UPI0035BC74A6